MKLVKVLFLFFSLIVTISYSQKNIDNPNDKLIVVDKVPIYKGCDENIDNVDLRECMMSSMYKFISSNFDTNISKKLNIPNGIVQIKVYFNINKRGKISNISADSEYKQLEKEAIRVFKLMPKMNKPGYINDRPVTIPYMLPIKFAIYN